ncbi:DUF3644 domain-containing protein [Psychrobacter jeotgali]|uniref:DUF3644 domain-containing protein n=1 Tax=Psychrobacter jeotgali TaxID=179010 RepID=UPI001D0FEB52|nr:DUF3644 domain-containing protein [Psychrobacter jeotgali]
MTKLRKGTKKYELVMKSREAALAAVQIFNNPNITFKSESFSVLIIISWTYLLHAYYENKGIEYRYYKKPNKRKIFDRTKHGAYKHWELERCLDNDKSPIDYESALNLKFLIGLRHEIEHQMTSRIDDSLSARYQACCLNYNHYICKFFGKEHGIEKHLSFSLQFSSISEEQKNLLSEFEELPENIKSYITKFDESISDEEYGSPKYAYRILFVPKTVNKRGQADKVIEFLKHDDPLAAKVNTEYQLIKETEKVKYLPKKIVSIRMMKGS